jgi:tetratricopeptide (TPR) repeat protein
MLLFVALGGAAIGVRHNCVTSATPDAATIPAPLTAQDEQAAHLAWPAMKWAIVPLLLAGLAYGLVVALPVGLGESAAITGDQQFHQGDFAAAAASYRAAADALPHLPNGDYATREVRALFFAHAPAAAIVQALDRAIATSSLRSQNWANRAEFRATLPKPDVAGSIADFDRALALDPANVQLHLTCAARLEAMGQRPLAISQYEEALRYNNALPAGELRRLPPERVSEIQTRMAALKTKD